MSEPLDKLERTVDREMAILEGLSAPGPSRAAVARVTRAVLLEGRRMRSRAALLGRLSRVSAVAAAIVLVLMLTWSTEQVRLVDAPNADALVLDDWFDALAESNDHIATLMSDGWLVDGLDGDQDDDEELQSLFDRLKQSMMIGA
ncbi:MAG: hypothetical protein IH986_05590 [Planctomycetes bacterium]|nr:hypothetical protein [Planctomycetota bacterium]